jgi:hypothetical protein
VCLYHLCSAGQKHWMLLQPLATNPADPSPSTLPHHPLPHLQDEEIMTKLGKKFQEAMKDPALQARLKSAAAAEGAGEEEDEEEEEEPTVLSLASEGEWEMKERKESNGWQGLLQLHVMLVVAGWFGMGQALVDGSAC